MRIAYALPPFLPDIAPGGGMLSVAENVLPATGGYRSVPAFSSVSAALPDTFMGGASFIASDGGAYLLAGTASTLSKLGSGAWTDLLTGLAVTKRWSFTQFGDHVIAANTGATQDVDLVAGTAAALAGAPAFSSVFTVGDFVVGCQPNGDLLRVRWSAFNDHTGWTLGVNQAGDQPMLSGGEVMGGAGGEYGVILQRHRIVRMSRTGDSLAPFQFDEIAANYGCASKASIATAGRTVFYLSDRGFAAVDDGQAPRLIGNEKFDRTFRASLAPDDYERMWSAIDPENSLVMWGIPGSPGTVWAYNWALDRAGMVKLAFEGIFAGFQSSVTLEGLDALYPSGIDSIPYSLDSPRFSGGAPRLYFVQSGEVGVLNGDTLAARIVTGQFAPAKDKTLRLRALWPDTDATNGVTVKATVAQRRGDTAVQVTSGAMQASGRVPVRANGRYVELEIDIAAGANWNFIAGCDIEAEQGGWRNG